MPSCYYYDEQRNRCNCYVNENLNELLAENAKLRNEVDNLLDFEHLTSVAVAYAGCDECGEYKQTMLRLFAENAKLRELCATVVDDWMSKVCPSFPFCEYGGEYQDCTDETCGNQIYRQTARELGVEVDA